MVIEERNDGVMAAKKTKPTKRPPKTRLTPIVGNHESLADAEAFYTEAWQLVVDGGVSLLMNDEKLVGTLLANYKNTCHMLVMARRQLENPGVAHAVALAKKLEELETKLEDVEYKAKEAARDLERHECCHDHVSNGNYFYG